MNEDEIFIYKFCLAVVVVPLVERGKETVEIFMPFIESQSLDDLGTSLGKFTPRHLGTNMLDELREDYLFFWREHSSFFYCWFYRIRYWD